MMPVWVGTSGWQYADWRPRFYPEKLPQRLWLEHYSERFATVEVNNAFYRLPERSVFARWRARTPAGFLVTVKASRYLTHIKRLKEPKEPVSRLMERAEGLKEKLGPILLQLPPDLRADHDKLEATLACFPKGTRVAVELRHPSWLEGQGLEATTSALARHNAAFCLADSPYRRTPVLRTADWGYVRFHAGRAFPPPCYGRRALRTWAERLADLFKEEEDVYAYFNNDPGACAVHDAIAFAHQLDRAGLKPSRVPQPSEVRLRSLSR